LLLSLGGCFLFGGVFLLFHIARGMGAGDVKLAAAMGSIVGLPGSVKVMFATALAGGVLAIIYMVVSGRVVQTLRNTINVVAFHARHGLRAHPLLNLDHPGALRMPYGLAFAAGSLYWAFITQSWR
jgi:prepilin peptidase CpaA